MSTERQKNASRANGSKSRGPATPSGKLVSSRNALKHGMLSGTIVLQSESTDRFDQLVAALFEEFQPQTPFEDSLIHNMAVARWRQMRVWGLEKAAMDYEMRRQAEMSDLFATEDNATRASIAFRTLSDDSLSLQLIKRYDSSYERQYYRAHRRFLEVRDRRTPPSGQPEIDSRDSNPGTFPTGGAARIHAMPAEKGVVSKRTPEVVANKQSPGSTDVPPVVLPPALFDGKACPARATQTPARPPAISTQRRRFRYRRAKPGSIRADRSSSGARMGPSGVYQGDSRQKFFIRR